MNTSACQTEACACLKTHVCNKDAVHDKEHVCVKGRGQEGLTRAGVSHSLPWGKLEMPVCWEIVRINL